MFDYVTITPAILIAAWVICFIAKLWIKDEKRRVIPTIAACIGAVLGLFTIGFDLDGFIVGAVSGLAATGADQMVKQFRKDTTITPDSQE